MSVSIKKLILLHVPEKDQNTFRSKSDQIYQCSAKNENSGQKSRYLVAVRRQTVVLGFELAQKQKTVQ